MRAGIALGSNVGDRLQSLIASRDALSRLHGAPDCLLSSGLYETEPVGTEPDASSFLNAVVELD
ncbi:MAG: 2-amino-4-hydroxy-6-hydroxymethyldihydropteridine diphosphokinase, partial [Verrucomicrobia bacterium]|nr:2-amino-4-hydroxy-6-hydroxymethyldihydropteridine diphosphokinase [Verrucomicrobiota bacterium]